MAKVLGSAYYRSVPNPGTNRYLHLIVIGYFLELFFLLSLVGIAAGSGYGIYWVLTSGTVGGYVRYKLVIFFATVILSVLPCLFVFRPRYRPFGFEIQRNRHPRLWSLIDEVARGMQTKPPDTIFLNHEVNAAVFEVGGIFGMNRKRIMIIGLGELSAVNISEFRATIAHELAHYAGKHTALNGWLIRTSERIELLAQEETPWLLALFVNFYLFVFMRFVGSLRRREEFYADEISARLVGRTAAMESLKKEYIYGYLQEHFYDKGGMNAIHDGINYFAALRQYAKSAYNQDQFPNIEKKIGAIYPTPYDQHPTYPERIAFLRRLPDKPHNTDTRLARELLDNPDEVENGLTKWMKVLIDLTPTVPRD
ncbi:MAG TPA: M48 family metalloprotease [Fimbriimonadales bacterium]|nr:M48 family metalloprotease [Fimbriimonadales bacterium]